MTFYGRSKDGVVQFSPIPYAEPPTDRLRWKAPILKTQYNDPISGNVGQSIKCTQRNDGQEDCLYLNIETSQEAIESKTKLPVLYFIHGGGFTGGSGMGSQKSAVKNQASDEFIQNTVE